MENLDSDVFSGLWRVLYNLYHTHDLNSSEYFNVLYERLTYGSTGQDIEQSIKALEWAMEHKDYNFREILPNMKFSNDYIIRFMDKYLRMLKSSFDEKTLVAMRTPSDQRKLRILFMDNWLAGDLFAKLTAYTTYDVLPADTTESAVTKYSNEHIDIVVLSLKSPDDDLEFLAGLQKFQEQNGHTRIPVLVILNAEHEANIEKLYELGCSKHLFWPVSRYLLLQEIYKLTTEE